MKLLQLAGFIYLIVFASFIKAPETEIIKTILTCPQLFHSEQLDATLQSFCGELTTFGPFHTADRLLLAEYPTLKTKLPWVELADLPTPVKKMEDIGTLLDHPHLYLKDDGLTDQKVGGNKIRKLETVLADAIYQGASDVCTFGCIGSNLVTETCTCAQKLGLGCSVYLKPEPNSAMVQNNLLLDHLYGAKMYFYPTEKFRQVGALNEVMQHKLNYGQFAYTIPTGASSPLGAVGYVDAAFELKDQIEKGLLPKPDYIYIAVGSLGTVAGLALGLRVAQIDSHIIAIGAQRADFEPSFFKLVKECNQLLNDLDSTFPLVDAETLSVTFDCDFVGKGYAHFTPEGCAAIDLFEEQEQLLLDGVYSCKCAAALIEHVKTKPELKDKIILFWNTFGIYEQIDDAQLYKDLPKSLHQFFE